MAYGTPNKPKSYYDQLARNYLAAGRGDITADALKAKADEATGNAEWGLGRATADVGGVKKTDLLIANHETPAGTLARAQKVAGVMPTPGTPIATPAPAARQAKRPVYNPFPGGLPGGMTSPGQLDKRRSYPIGGQQQANPQEDMQVQTVDTLLQDLPHDQRLLKIQQMSSDLAMAPVLERSKIVQLTRMGQKYGIQPSAPMTPTRKLDAEIEKVQKIDAIHTESQRLRASGRRNEARDKAREAFAEMDGALITDPEERKRFEALKKSEHPDVALDVARPIFDRYNKKQISQQQRFDADQEEQKNRLDAQGKRQAKAEDWKQHGLQEKRIERAQKVLDKLNATDPAYLTDPQKGRIKELQRQIRAAQRVRNEIESRLGGIPPEDVIDEDLPEEGQKPSVWNPFPAPKPGITGQPTAQPATPGIPSGEAAWHQPAAPQPTTQPTAPQVHPGQTIVNDAGEEFVNQNGKWVKVK